MSPAEFGPTPTDVIRVWYDDDECDAWEPLAQAPGNFAVVDGELYAIELSDISGDGDYWTLVPPSGETAK